MPDSREWALLVWVAIIAIALLAWGPTRSSLFDVARSALHPLIVLPVLALAVWSGALIVGALYIGLWDWHLATESMLWFLVMALVLLFNLDRAVREDGYFARAAIAAFRLAIFIEVMVNLYVFGLLAEIILLPVVTILALLAAVAGQDPRLKSVKAFFEIALASIGIAMISYVTIRLLSGWDAVDETEIIQALALPVWLTTGILPFLYVLNLLVTYQGAFKRIAFSAQERKAHWRARLALFLVLGFRMRDLGSFGGYWAKEIASSTSIRDARQVVEAFRAERQERRLSEAQQLEALRQYAGVDGEGDEHRRLDQREFAETKDALRGLATAQMGWYRNRGGHYRPELLTILEPRFVRSGLPVDHGISLEVEDEGQSWWAWRRTVTGWCFAIGAVAPPPDEWLYDGPEPPFGPPDKDPAWGERWGIDAKNW